MFAMIKNGKIQCGNVSAQNTTFGWVIGGRVQVSPAQPTITTFHNIVDIDKQLQRFWELEEMFPSANRLTAEEAAWEQYFIDSNHRAEDKRYTVNHPMKQTKDQSLAIEPLQLCTNHKPNTKSAIIKKRHTSVYIAPIIEKTTFFKQYSALTQITLWHI
jgi:hypothetical protein